MRWIVLAACVALWPAAQAAGGQQGAASCPGTLANRLASTGAATQLVTVVAARARSAGNGPLAQGVWRWAPRGQALDGVARRARRLTGWREGDRGLAGAFGLLPTMCSVAASPASTVLPRIVSGDWWVETRAALVHRFRHVPRSTPPPDDRGSRARRPPTGTWP
jgi:hypothetical protein